MKTSLLRLAALALSAAGALGAPLTQTTAVHTKPDAGSPAISYLKAGTEPVAATDAPANIPAGWMAVALPGPFQAYVNAQDLTKGLDVKPGAPIRTAPRADAPVLTIAKRGDKTSITGIQGRWTQINLQKNLVGYIHVANAAAFQPPPAAPEAAATASAAAAPGPASSFAGTSTPSPAPGPAAYTGTPVSSDSQGGPGNSSSALPRQFTGKFTSTRSLFHPRRPYDWQLVDNAGRRYAYVDVSKLLLTDPISDYAGHYVVVFGAAQPVPGSHDIVIRVESLQLLMR